MCPVLDGSPLKILIRKSNDLDPRFLFAFQVLMNGSVIYIINGLNFKPSVFLHFQENMPFVLLVKPFSLSYSVRFHFNKVTMPDRHPLQERPGSNHRHS